MKRNNNLGQIITSGIDTNRCDKLYNNCISQLSRIFVNTNTYLSGSSNEAESLEGMLKTIKIN